eukprot:scaffold1167_cov154-Isochrysis_galbana.AAC.3
MHMTCLAGGTDHRRWPHRAAVVVALAARPKTRSLALAAGGFRLKQEEELLWYPLSAPAPGNETTLNATGEAAERTHPPRCAGGRAHGDAEVRTRCERAGRAQACC